MNDSFGHLNCIPNVAVEPIIANKNDNNFISGNLSDDDYDDCASSTPVHGKKLNNIAKVVEASPPNNLWVPQLPTFLLLEEGMPKKKR